MKVLVATVTSVWLFLSYIFHAMMKTDLKIAAPSNKSTSPKKKKTPAKKKDSVGSTSTLQKSNSGNAITVLCRRMAGSNWESAPESKSSSAAGSNENKPPIAAGTKKKKPRKIEKWTKFIAMDCEMVGIGEDGRDDMLARVSIVNRNGDVLLDKYVKPQEPVVDYRTKVSGIRPQDMENGEEFEKVQEEVINLLRDRVLVGHSIKNDLSVLKLKHPMRHIRDTAKYRPLAKLVSNGATPSLKRLAKAILGTDIQGGEHSSVEDARAVMSVYVRFSAEWETYLQKIYHHRPNHGRHRS